MTEEINPIEVWIKKFAVLTKKGFSPILDRTMDSFFKYLLDGTVLEKFAKEVTGEFFQKEINSVSEKLDNEFKIAYGKRDFWLDTVCRADSTLVGIEMERRKAFVLERFFLYWGVMVSNRKKGEPTKNLTTHECLQVVLTRGGIHDKTRWIECWQTFPRDYFTGKLLGKANPKGINVLVIDLINFKRLVKAPRRESFLENFLTFITTTNLEDTIQMYRSGQYDILEDVFQRDVSFLDNRYKWGRYMKETKSVLAEKENTKAEAERADKAEAEAKAQSEARKKAEAEAKANAKALQKAEAEAKANSKALQKAEAKNAKLLAILAENGINISSD